jgi:hypothetical protein
MPVTKEGAFSQRVDKLGDRLVRVLEQEDDAAVMLSALALAVAVACDFTGGGNPTAYATVAEEFVRTFHSIRYPAAKVH